MPGLIQPKREVAFNLLDGSATVQVWPLHGGPPNTMSMQITREQWTRWQNGEYIQNALSHLTPDEREFLLSGMTPQEWDAMCEDFEDDNDD